MRSFKTASLCLILLIIVLFAGTGSFNWLMGALSPIVLAFFIIYFLQPFVNNLQRVSSLPRWLCILLSFLCIILILLAFVFLLTPRLKILLSLDYSALLPYFPLDQLLQNLLAPLARYSASAIQWMADLGMSLCITFYALMDCKDLCQSMAYYIKKLFSLRTAHILLNILDILDTTCWTYLRGRLYTSLILAVICSLAFFLLNLLLRFSIPSPLLLAVIIGLTNLIPIFGTILGTIFCLVFALLSGFPEMLAVLAVCLGAQLFDNMWLTPRLGAPFGLRPFWTLVGLIIFGSLWGFFGIFLAVPLSAAVTALWRQYNKNPQFLFQCPSRFK